MSEYLIINIVIIFIPLLLSFENKIKYYQRIPALLISIIIVGTIYVIWDDIAASRGDWSFNQQFLTGIYILNLPIEEILFFITVPYSIIFLYETSLYYLEDTELVFNCSLFTYIAAFFIVLSLLYSDRYYTMTVFFFTGLFFITARFLFDTMLKSKLFWGFVLFTFLPFLLINYLLTSLPVVRYNSDAVLGFRVATIPLEDFFYSFSLISFYLLVYLLAKEKWLKRK